MKFAVSYSGGKESALSLYRAIEQGHTPVVLITTFNTDADRSHFHGLTKEVLEAVSTALDIPIIIVKTNSANYAQDFENALIRAKDMGAEACVFGDIDIEGHRTWCSERCNNTGLEPLFPLWGESRSKIVYELIDKGFVADITVVNTKYLADSFLGQRLTKDTAEDIAAQGADICGENGEYHTFVSGGPIFKQPIDFALGEKNEKDGYAVMPVILIRENSHRFFRNYKCRYFPCHKEPSEDSFSCLFCYCPLYFLGEDCGGIFEYRYGVKDCTDCYLPHMPEYYDVIVKKLSDAIVEGADVTAK